MASLSASTADDGISTDAANTHLSRTTGIYRTNTEVGAILLFGPCASTIGQLSSVAHPAALVTTYATLNYGQGYAGLGGDLMMCGAGISYREIIDYCICLFNLEVARFISRKIAFDIQLVVTEHFIASEDFEVQASAVALVASATGLSDSNSLPDRQIDSLLTSHKLVYIDGRPADAGTQEYVVVPKWRIDTGEGCIGMR